jgi:hypothetical protein
MIVLATGCGFATFISLALLSEVSCLDAMDACVNRARHKTSSSSSMLVGKTTLLSVQNTLRAEHKCRKAGAPTGDTGNDNVHGGHVWAGCCTLPVLGQAR